jgi:CubicO group peptidase (beta-lactamase class C family)
MVPTPEYHAPVYARGRRRLLTVLITTLLVVVTSAAPAPVDVAALDEECSSALKAFGTPGMAVAVVQNGAPLLIRGYGVREVGRSDTVDEHTAFAIASNTKAFTAAAVAMLVDRGVLGWDDRVSQHLPWFRLKDPAASAGMRIRDLLSHRSGLGTFSGDLLWYGTTYERAEVIRRARYLDPASPFRTQYGYQNVMYIAAGEVIAAAAGVSWDEFMDREFLRPLRMTDTRSSVRTLDLHGNTATPHGTRHGKAQVFPWRNWDNAAPAGGLISSAADMSRWMLLQLGRGTFEGRHYFSDESSRTMWTPHVSFTVDRDAQTRTPSTHFRGYGLGWSLRDYEGRLVAEHGGAYDGMFSRVLLVPDDRLGIVVLTNGMSGLADALARTLADRILGVTGPDWTAQGLEAERRRDARKAQAAERRRQRRLERTEPTLPLAQYVGTYGGPLYGDARVTLEEGRLVLRLEPNSELTADLTHWHADTFHLQWRTAFPWFDEGLVQFVLDPDVRVVELKLDVPNDDFWFHELPFPRRD